jgi:hypothetical protein
MSEGRALLTEREREAIAGDRSDSYRYKTRSYFRDRLKKLEGDIAVLAEHDPELLEELQATVCEGDVPTAYAETDEQPRAEGKEPARAPPLEPESSPSTTGDQVGRGYEAADRGETGDGVPEVIDVDDDLVALVEDLDLPGGGSKLEKRRAAIAEILTFMRDAGEASRQQILTIAERHEFGGYASGVSFRSNVWSNDALPQLKERGVVEAADTTGVYEFGGT